MAGNSVADTLVSNYVAGWKAADSKTVLDTLLPDCVVIESHGPTYRGRDQVERWIESWFREGNRIERWDITSLVAGNDECAFEWVFSYVSDESQDSFEGASFARISDDKIALLREYRMTDPRYEWTG